MEENFVKNASVFISSKTHLNITFNIHQCGNYDVRPGRQFSNGEEDVFVIYYVNQGVCWLESEEYTGKISAGKCFIILPQVDYQLKAVGKEVMNLTWVAFSGFRVEDYLRRAAIWPGSPVIDDPEGILGEKINRLYMFSHEPINRYCKMASVLYEIIAYLRDIREKTRPDGYKENLNYFAACAASYIERNYMNPISVNEVADKLGITRKHLCTVFHRVFGVAPRQYIIYFRMEKACRLLRSTRQTVQEIAEAAGYANQFYFAKEFRRIVGKTPTEYRREGGGDEEIFSRKAFTAALLGELEEENDWGLPITPEGKMEERKRKYATALHSMIQ